MYQTRIVQAENDLFYVQVKPGWLRGWYYFLEGADTTQFRNEWFVITKDPLRAASFSNKSEADIFKQLVFQNIAAIIEKENTDSEKRKSALQIKRYIK